MRGYRALRSVFRIYLREYGGLGELFVSPFFHISLALASLASAGIIGFDWRSTAAGALPTAIGFSLTAYTVAFTLMGSSVHAILHHSVDPALRISRMKSVNVTFFHVVLVECAAYFFAVFTKGEFFWNLLGASPTMDTIRGRALWLILNTTDFLGAFLVTYAIALFFSISIAIFRLGRLGRVVPSQAGTTGAANSQAASPNPNLPVEPLPPTSVSG